MRIGYARVSTDKQNLAMQVDQLEAAGAEKIFTDIGISGKAVIKPSLREALDYARAGDCLLVWRLDRLCRNLGQLIREIEEMEQRQIHLHSLREKIDTSSAAGTMYLHMIGALAQFERDLIADRTKAGLASARAKGKRLGRPPVISDDQWSQAKKLIEDEGWPVAQVARLIGVSRQALYKRMKAEAATTDN